MSLLKLRGHIRDITLSPILSKTICQEIQGVSRGSGEFRNQNHEAKDVTQYCWLPWKQGATFRAMDVTRGVHKFGHSSTVNNV
jgi:hypothetical protein